VIGAMVLVFGATGVLVEFRDAIIDIWEVPFRRMSKL
jgi:hypothetical protein